MATVEEVRNAKESVKSEILERVKKNPDVGIHEFAKHELETMGVDTKELKTSKDIADAVKGLDSSQKRTFGKDLKVYEKDYRKATDELKKGMYSGVLELPKKVIATIAKGAGIGMSVAGIVNTVAPNLFPAAVGFAAGAIEMDVLVKLGLVTLGAFSTPVIAQGAVLGVGAVAGAAIYATGKAVTGTVKGIHNKIKENNDLER